ncbi:MAG TPA: diaminopimelate decarboxylase [Actinomycetota bacterium]|nr:diaminopimelate decarboxylase [Actinomycetota bacterium]
MRPAVDRRPRGAPLSTPGLEVFPDTAEVSPAGHLVVGGCDVPTLASEHATPLIVFDRATLENRAAAFGRVVEPQHVVYAAKAFCCVAVCEILRDLGLGLDVCTGGELATALAAGFPPERMVFHGNNKSVDELRMALDAGVGRVVADSFEELRRLREVDWRNPVLIRVTPGVEAHTHEYVQTGHEDSKFGFPLADGIALSALRTASGLELDVAGLHAHIGSQIFEKEAFELAASRLADLAGDARSELGLEVRELDLGGGLGIAYTPDDDPPDPGELAAAIVAVARKAFSAHGLALPAILFEPGRALAGPAGVTVYRVGTVKRIPRARGHADQPDRVYVSVDGGLSDNPRYALYGAKYEAALANRMGDPASLWCSIAGKHCESGDILVRDVRLPEDVAPGDLLCIPATGAYTYSMASNYNRVPRPPVVLVENGEAAVIVRRETYDDVLRLDVPLST